MDEHLRMGKCLCKAAYVARLTMTSEARPRIGSSQAFMATGIHNRKPQRITITISWSVYQKLIEVSNAQGRSLSNTAAYWLERQSEEIDRQAA